MERQAISSSGFDWAALLQHVVRDQATVDLQQDQQTVARIMPLRSPVLVSQLNSILSDVPELGEDADSFAADIG